MKRAFVLVLVSAALLAALPVPADDPALDTEEKKTFYALGYMVARNLGPFQLTAEDLAVVEKGIRDGVQGNEPKVDLAKHVPLLDALAKRRTANAAQEEIAAGQMFLEQEAAKPGAMKLDSGVLYFETLAGTGATPAATDKVKVHYHGTLRDGTVFDSSVDRGAPTEFPLSGVITCFRDGIMKMKVGGKSRLVCPPDAAYGDRGSGQFIRPGATILFDVELLEIVQPEPAQSPVPQESPTP